MLVDDEEVLLWRGGGGGALYFGCCSEFSDCIEGAPMLFPLSAVPMNLWRNRSTVIVSASTVVASSCKTFLSAYTTSNSVSEQSSEAGSEK